ncbi:NucA/NucB deoxyribonuclease domain-containing protein [Nonomuraea basaltis]|uniref:NucA/NucB deoxyribonuclease domain-containing protein n=1 Tax=Nonomuraea basaltis TaxID=2495887 RepID=UPI00110C5611|nr:hypothetical protein [Nonomuraea basaltis]TMR92828.1 hypothetical protein EJK15_42500 [Nonomuraea basaltis]
MDEPQIDNLRAKNAAAREKSDQKPEVAPRRARVEPPTGSCDQVKKKLPELRAKGLKKVVCRPAESNQAQARAADPIGGIPEGFPAWCADGYDRWEYTRYDACSWQIVTLQWVWTDTGELAGTLDLAVWHHILTAQNEGVVGYDIAYYAFNPRDDWDPETQLRPELNCTGRCTPASKIGPWTTPQLYAWTHLNTTFESTVPIPGRGPLTFDGGLVQKVGEDEMDWILFEPAVWPPVVRCDDGMLKGYPTTQGCVIREFRPVMVYKHSVWPELVEHVAWSQSLGSPGAPGDAPLQRMYSDADALENNATACADAPNPRPAGMQCDEYPMARTYQGAYTCGCDDWTWRLVPDWQNENAGIQYATFVRENRLLDGDAFNVDPRMNE